MGLRPNKVNSETISADVLKKIAAINHLAVTDVVRLFLAEALREGRSIRLTAKSFQTRARHDRFTERERIVKQRVNFSRSFSGTEENAARKPD